MIATIDRISHRRVRARQVRATLAAALLLPSATGCYVSRPIWNGQPVPGTEISLGLTDRGRVALSDRLGPGALTVSGRLASATDSLYVVDVTRVAYIDGGRVAKWNGESVNIAKNDVSGIAERRLSKSRSWVAAGIAAGLLALATGIVINGTAGPDPQTKPTDGGPQPQ
jgi:hypothetical protein